MLNELYIASLNSTSGTEHAMLDAKRCTWTFTRNENVKPDVIEIEFMTLLLRSCDKPLMTVRTAIERANFKTSWPFYRYYHSAS